MKEMSKSIPRRQRDPNFIVRYFVGDGIDVGGLPDPLSLYTEMFPLIRTVKVWDMSDGDAQFMDGVLDNSYDFVTSSHCLEHLHNPMEGIQNWFRILRPGGHLIITIPEEDLYEQGTWPSDKNLDHKYSFTILKSESWSPKSINVFDLITNLGDQADVRKISIEDSGYRYQMAAYDQTMSPISESAIEIVIRKKTLEDAHEKVNHRSNGIQPSQDLRRYYNQYRLDLAQMKINNSTGEPFRDASEI